MRVMNEPAVPVVSELQRRPCVLVFSGHDPSGGAGMQADIEAIAAQRAHALPVITALTVQDNDHVYAVHAVDAEIIRQQAMALLAKIAVSAIKIGIVGNSKNAMAIASIIQTLQHKQPGLPVVLDPVLASGQGDALAREDVIAALQPLLQVATLITPNLPEAARLCPASLSSAAQAQQLLRYRCTDVLLKGGHDVTGDVCNRWFGLHGQRDLDWSWPRLPGEFHGSGCTLAAAIAGQLAHGRTMSVSLQLAQDYTQRSLRQAYAIAGGQLIPLRHFLD